MKPFRFMYNEIFGILITVALEIYEVFEIRELLMKIFETDEKFKKVIDWYMIHYNVDYELKELDKGKSFIISVEVYNLMKLYHKNFDTRSIAFIFRNVVMFSLRFIVMEGIEEWEKFRDNVVILRGNFMSKYEEKLRKKFRRMTKKITNKTFSENIYSLSRVKRHRISTYDEDSSFFRQIIRA